MNIKIVSLNSKKKKIQTINQIIPWWGMGVTISEGASLFWEDLWGLTQEMVPTPNTAGHANKEWHPRRGRSEKELWPGRDKHQSPGQVETNIKDNQTIWGRRKGVAGCRAKSGQMPAASSAQCIIRKWVVGLWRNPGREVAFSTHTHSPYTHPTPHTPHTYPTPHTYTTHTHTTPHNPLHTHTPRHLAGCLRAVLIHKHSLWPLLSNVQFLLLYCSDLANFYLSLNNSSNHFKMLSLSRSHVPSTLTQPRLHTPPLCSHTT